MRLFAWGYAAVVLFSLAIPLCAQAPAGTPLRCTIVQESTPGYVRAEGYAELLPDIVLKCTGGDPIRRFTASAELFLNTSITGRQTDTYSEALLLLDEPGAPRPGGIPGPEPVPGVNVFQAQQTASNRVTWTSIPIQPPGNDRTLTIRIVNVRADATAIGESATLIPTQILGYLAFLPQATLPIDNPQITLGLVRKGLIASVRGPGLSDSGRVGVPACTPNNTTLIGAPFNPDTHLDMVLRFQESFPTAFRARYLSEWGQPQAGASTHTESGYFYTSFPPANGLNRAGQATTATRLTAKFLNVPPGVSLFVTTTTLSGQAYPVANLIDAPSGDVILHNGEHVPIAPVAVVGGTGTAAWEVYKGNALLAERYDIGLAIALNSPGVVPADMKVQLSLGPSDSLSLPRFRSDMATELTIPIYPCTTAPPDLRLQSFDTTRFVQAGEPVRATAVLRNYSPSNSPAFDYKLELLTSQNSLVSTSRVRLPGLPAHSTIEVRPSVALPATTPSGSYTVRLTLDVNSEVAEAQEGNNVASSSISVDCGEMLTSSVLLAPPAGGSLSLPVQSACPLFVLTEAAWVTAGVGTVVVTPNATGQSRSGIVRINNRRPLPVIQLHGSAGCTFTLADAAGVVPAMGSTRNLTLTASQPACSWTSATNGNWLQVYPLSGTGSAQLQLTVFPNFGTTERAGRVGAGSGMVDIRQYGGTGSEARRAVQQIYFNFFGRLPSEPEIVLQAGELERGVPLFDLISRFYGTPEFNSGGRFIAGLYVGLMNRDAEYGGWLFQRNALSQGIVTQTSLVANFLDSAEWKLRNGSPDNPGFVRLMYRQVLLREPSQAEVDFHAGTLASGQLDRVQLTNNFLNSEEFRIGTGPRLTAFLLHATLYFRDASQAEFDTVVAKLMSGIKLAAVIEEIAATPEFARTTE